MTVSEYTTLIELVHEGAQARAAMGDGKAETLPARLIAGLMSCGRARDILKIKAAADNVYGQPNRAEASLEPRKLKSEVTA